MIGRFQGSLFHGEFCSGVMGKCTVAGDSGNAASRSMLGPAGWSGMFVRTFLASCEGSRVERQVKSIKGIKRYKLPTIK